MSFFRKYEKINRLGKEETDGILDGLCYIEEKIDGANLSVWIEDGEIHVGSRNNDVTNNGTGFNGAVEYCRNHEGIKKLLSRHPELRLYGEWLVKHTVDYKATAYKKFYLFDIFDHSKNEFFDTMSVRVFSDDYEIDAVPFLAKLEKPTLEQIMIYVGKSQFGDRGEGVVIKNPNFINKFGSRECAKIVTESFKEDSGIVFGGNNKFSDTYWEVYVVNKYMTLPRVQKIMNKIQPMVDKKLGMEHIPRISATAYHDMLTEEIWEISKNAQGINFNSLKRIAIKKAIQIYKDIINDTISIADRIN